MSHVGISAPTYGRHVAQMAKMEANFDPSSVRSETQHLLTRPNERSETWNGFSLSPKLSMQRNPDSALSCPIRLGVRKRFYGQPRGLEAYSGRPLPREFVLSSAPLLAQTWRGQPEYSASSRPSGLSYLTQKIPTYASHSTCPRIIQELRLERS